MRAGSPERDQPFVARREQNADSPPGGEPLTLPLRVHDERSSLPYRHEIRCRLDLDSGKP
jgi:hypothetical protein